MKYGQPVGRRQVLRGAGGFTLGLPFLPSLVARPAFSAELPPGRTARFVAMTTEHGAVRQENMYPDAATLPNKETLFTGHLGAWGPLARAVNGATASLSKVLSAPATQLTDRIVGKMNVLRGLDIPLYIAHNTGGHLGNYARNDGNGDPGKYAQMFPMPTIDQIMGWSPSFYKTMTGIRERVMVTGSRGGFSWNYSNPANKTGTIQEIQRVESPRALFDKVFIPGSTQEPIAQRKPIVDRVLQNYKLLRDGNRRISAGDKQRLDDHMTRIAELQNRVQALPQPVGSCKDSIKPASDGTGKARYQAMNDVIATAFICGSSRLAVVSVADVFAAFTGSWHQETAHQWPDPAAQARLVDHHQKAFEWVFLDLVRKLDVEEFAGITYLDSTLVAWSQESGQSTHDSIGIPMITAGSAAGYFKTGLYADYRNVRPQSVFPYGLENGKMYSGLPWNRWLGTALDAMRIPRGEFEKSDMKGYGLNYFEDVYKKMAVAGALDSGNQPMPFIVA